MAKEKMICPFSGKLCRECPIYRGRHYFLCFNKTYRGHLNTSKKMSKVNSSILRKSNTENLFNLQELTVTNPIDPYAMHMPDVAGNDDNYSDMSDS